jgi:hypothetical protein
MKYIFKQIDNISGSNAVTTIEFDADTMPTILEHFEMFLRGSGFHPSGVLDFIDEEDEYTTPKFEFNEESYEDDLSEDEDEAEEEWPFPKERPIEGSNEVPWPGVAPSVSAQYAVKDSNAN